MQVLCTKTKPNCNACPLRKECKYFLSKSRFDKNLLLILFNFLIKKSNERISILSLFKRMLHNFMTSVSCHYSNKYRGLKLYIHEVWAKAMIKLHPKKNLSFNILKNIILRVNHIVPKVRNVVPNKQFISFESV